MTSWFSWSSYSSSSKKTGTDPSEMQDIKVEETKGTPEINFAKSTRHAIRRIHCNSLPGLKKVLDELKSEDLVQQLFITEVDKVTIRKGTVSETIDVDETVLCYALEHGSYEIVEYIVSEVIKDKRLYSNIDIDGFSPIHCAAINKDTRVFELLFKDNEIIRDVNIRTLHGNTPLHFATRYGNSNNVRALLALGVEYHITNDNGEYPIHWAAFGGYIESFKQIFEKYESEDIEKYKMRVNDEIPKVRNEWESFSAKFKDETELENAIKKKARERVERSISKKFGEHCLHLSGTKCGVPLLCAAQNVAIAVHDTSNPDRHFECMQFILDHQRSADATCRDDDCDTPLHFISRKANADQIAKILKANALLGVKNEVGNVPLDWISKETMCEVLDNHLQKIDLEAKKGDVNTKDQFEILFTNLFGHHASGSDIKNILALAQSSKHQDLALHPVCQSILSAKWQKMWKYFVIKLLFFIPFVILLSVYPILQSDLEKAINDTETAEKIKIQIGITYHFLYYLLIIQVIFGTLSVLVLINPFYEESKVYLAHINTKRIMRVLEFYWTELLWSDWYEYILWVFAFLLLNDKISPLPVVIVAWFSLFLVCSNHPTILPFRYILVKILFRYIQFFIFAFGLISGFAMGFFLLMKECKEENGAPCVNGAFTSISTTALKIPSMMMGEISFEAFSLERAYPHVYFLFGAFIFLITCCLFNMMNGLAINITEEMMKKAHIFKTIAQCDMTYEFEILLKEVSGWIHWFGIRNINFLSPLWIERLKASPSSGKCKNLDEISVCKNPKQLKADDLWETNKLEKAKWFWHDRGYELDRKIIYNANTMIVEELKKNAEGQKWRENVLYDDPASHESDDDDDEENIPLKTPNSTDITSDRNSKLLSVPAINIDDADSEAEDDVTDEQEQEKLL